MTRIERIGPATLILGDVLTALDGLPPVDAVITDPPYSSGGTHTAQRADDPRRKYLQRDSGNRALPTFHGDMRDQRAFTAWGGIWTSKALDVAREGAPIVAFTDWRQLGATTDYVQVGGWVWRGVAVWTKPAARTQRGRFASAAEYIVWGSKGAMPADRGVPPLKGVFRHPSPCRRVHVTQKPEGLMADLVEICVPGGVVLDPFMGSGTTGVAALRSGRGFVGVEKSAEFFEIACARLREALTDMDWERAVAVADARARRLDRDAG